jgi:hypothetical protein
MGSEQQLAWWKIKVKSLMPRTQPVFPSDPIFEIAVEWTAQTVRSIGVERLTASPPFHIWCYVHSGHLIG